MIKRIVMHRFRGLREGILEDIGRVNLLIGPNNSGKTAILEMLYLGGTSGRACELVLESVPDGTFPATTSLRFDLLGLEPLPRLCRRHGIRDRWEGAPATLTEEKGVAVTLSDLPKEHPFHNLRLGAPLPEPGWKDNTAFSKKDLGMLALFSLDRQKGIPSEVVPTWFIEQKVTSEISRWHYLWRPDFVYTWERQEPIDHMAVWIEEGPVPDASRVLLFDFHTACAHFTDRFARWAYTKIPDWHEKTAESLIRVFPNLAGARVEVSDAPDGQKGKTGYIRFTGRTPLAIDQFGDGMRHTFKALASLIGLAAVVDEHHPGMFLWEDPELFMHPESLGRLLEEMVRLVQDKPIQIFLSTQSLEVVALLTHYFREQYAGMQETLRAFRLELEAGRLSVARFYFKNLLTWLEQGMDPRYWGVVDLPVSCRYRDAEKTTI
ncbi:MAG: AAA family ATPase [Deltaproteobacteria bacterium]|nr:AAA family ATPase [Deltaproteobacteria bacterium]